MKEWLPPALLLVALGVVWTWWAWRQGAYLGVVFYPGAIALCVVALALLPSAPWRSSLRLSWGAAVVLAGLTMLGGWTLLSMLWSPAPDEALSDAGRVLFYALSFSLGMWLAQMLAGRALLSLLPLAAAGGVAAVATAIALTSPDDLARYIGVDGTLQFPIGYRNANAAFFLIAAWPALALASSPQIDWRLRGVMLGCAAICLEIAVLSQSRGSVVAMLPALFVWLLVSPRRLRSLAWLALAAIPAAAALPWLLDVYTTFNADEPLRPVLAAAGRAMLVTAAAAVLVGAAVARLEPAPRKAPALDRSLLPAALGGCAALVLAATGGLIISGEDPVDFVNQRVAEIKQPQSPDLTTGATRFTVNASSKRSDLWRVAWEDAREDPLLGEGAGGFEYSYLQGRRVDELARDAHSVELELASELGFPAVVMFGAVVIGAAAAGLRSRRVNPAAATLSAAALTAGAYWLVHASIEWFWTYPVLTAPVFALIGSAAAPAVLDSRRSRAGRGRLAVALVATAAAAAAVPLYLSERYTDDAYRIWGSDLQRAYSDLDLAQDLNPFSDEPLLAEGAIAREAGNRNRAIEAFRAAADRKPDDWVSHYLLGRALAQSDPNAARRELAIAAALNPQSNAVRRALADVRDPAQLPNTPG